MKRAQYLVGMPPPPKMLYRGLSTDETPAGPHKLGGLAQMVNPALATSATVAFKESTDS